jgi:hypothetical protein
MSYGTICGLQLLFLFTNWRGKNPELKFFRQWAGPHSVITVRWQRRKKKQTGGPHYWDARTPVTIFTSRGYFCGEMWICLLRLLTSLTVLPSVISHINTSQYVEVNEFKLKKKVLTLIKVRNLWSKIWPPFANSGVDCVWNVMAHAQKTDFVFRRNGRVHLNRQGGASVQSTTGSRGVRISGTNAGYTMFRGSAKGTGYPLHSPVSPSLPFPSRASMCAITFQPDSNAGYTMFWGSVKGTGYPLHSSVSPSLPLPCVNVCHQISTGL